MAKRMFRAPKLARRMPAPAAGPFQYGEAQQLEMFNLNSAAKFITPEDIAKCSGHRVGIDVETTGLHWWSDKLLGVGIYCPDAGVEGYYDCRESEEQAQQAKDAVRSWGPGTVVIAHNLKFELHFLGIDPTRMPWKLLVDTLVLAHLHECRGTKEGFPAKTLGSQAKLLLGEDSKESFYAGKSSKIKRKLWLWPKSEIAAYCANDARLTYRLAEVLVPKIRELDMWPLFTNQMEYLARVWQIERWGMATDMEFLERALAKMLEDVSQLEVALYNATGKPEGFNWRANKALSKALYEDMGIEKPVWDGGGDGASERLGTEYTDTSTSTFLLMEKAHHPLGQLVMELRESDKLATTLKKWKSLRDSEGVVHCNFNLAGTRTGRLSSSEPNFQNLPSDVRSRVTQSVYSGSQITRTAEYNLRQVFVPRPGNVIVAVDYKQMEIRMFGLLAGDENMLEALRTGDDIHARVATAIWGESDKVKREWAKTISFGLIYGMTSGSLQFRLNMTADQARGIADRYWKTFPRVKPWLMEVINACRQDGYVTYWSGRRWSEADEIKLYKAANALVQGGSHDLLMVAVCRVAAFLEEHYPQAHICNLVHDEIDVEMPQELVAELTPKIQEIMEVPDLLNLRFFNDVKVGTTYGSMHEWPEKEPQGG